MDAPFPSDPLKAKPAPCADIEYAILSSLAYRDVFGFAVTAQELYRFLHYAKCTYGQMMDVLANYVLPHGEISTDGTYYCLKGQEACLAERSKREAHVEKKLAVARQVGRLLSGIPNVRMVALTGSLAARNSQPGDDIDIFCITDQGKLWRTRALAQCVRILDNKTKKREICPNFFVSTAALKMEHQGMYIAHELAQMVPMYGLDVYHEMRRQNPWADAFLPNATTAPDFTDGLSVTPGKRRKAVAEWVIGSFLGNWLERFESTRKIRKFNAEGYYDVPHQKFSKERTGHSTHIANWVEQEWVTRTESLGLPSTGPSPRDISAA